jgi:aspartyl-tRNA(Asn)/glutamyl-tRNA(Gln) amidotransferase subunit A
MSLDLTTLTIKKAHDMLMSGETTAPALAKAYLDVIAAKNPDIHAYLEVYDNVMIQAEFAQKRIDAKENVTMLTGIPLAIKDNITVKGYKASAASKILENYVAPYDATVITKLQRGSGAVLIGRVNMDEFAMGGSTENSAFGATKNPVDTSRVPGGSSGGSAAAVAMEGALGALGSDTGGSIRQPASFTGIVGLKPTYGSVSRYGLMAMASSLDVIGPITKTVEDAEILFNAIKGKDVMDATSRDADSYAPATKSSYTIGVPRGFLKEGVDPDVLADFESALERLKAQGHTIKDIELPYLPYSLAVYYILMPAEVSSNLARLDGVKYGSLKEGKNLLEDYLLTRGSFFGKEARRRIMLGTYVLSAGYADAYYNKAGYVRRLIQEDFTKAFADVDAIATPVSPTPAFKIGERSANPLQMYLADIFTVGANLARIPAISIPSGTVEREGANGAKSNMPVGLHLMAPEFGESILFDIGKKFYK